MKTAAKSATLAALALLAVAAAWALREPSHPSAMPQSSESASPTRGELPPVERNAAAATKANSVAKPDDAAQPTENATPQESQVEANTASTPAPVEASKSRATPMHIRGTVLDPRGAPVRASVIATDTHGHIFGCGVMAAGREFDVRVPEPGVYTLTAHGVEVAWLSSKPLDVDAGAGDVTLRLRRTSTVFGNVVDAATGLRCEGQINFWRPGEALPSATADTRDGEFRAELAWEDTYVLSARSSAGAWCVQLGVVVASESDVGPLRLELQRPAKMRVKYRGPATFVHCRVIAGDLEIDQMSFSPERGFACDVPPREITVELSDPHHAWTQQRTVTPKPGEQLDVVFD